MHNNTYIHVLRIKKLTVSNCNMERLYGDVFRNLNVTEIVIKVSGWH